ncbi:hypothetical protein A6770_10175 [Nostoc minutum NIES-26]|uniref:Calx-beta domain-containing protein n=1 Tax=Nostoc minutum NIES-26 TaxID=1844469 RepID=A0A367RYJ4_9NOSO|nr:hypothetical protein A6770_10175 [Nostoc minutum NIES-26]
MANTKRSKLLNNPATLESDETVLAKPYQVIPGYDSPYASGLTNINGTLYFFSGFSINNPDYGGVRLWKSDGTKAGTIPVKDVYNISTVRDEGTEPDAWTNVNGIFYFLKFSTLWRSDGTPEGTGAAVTFPGGWRYARFLANINGTLYFAAPNPDSEKDNYDLWKSDGTQEGTFRLKELYPDNSFVRIDSSININDTLYFTVSRTFYNEEGNDEGRQTSFWKTDGTTAGTVESDIYPSNLTAVNNIFYFTSGGLWKSDGTEAGTVKVKDINAGSLRNFNDTLYFVGDDGIYGGELWTSDGTAEGTVLVKDINPGSSGSSISFITEVNGTLYFRADNGTSGLELWKSDGTAEGTVLVKDINPGSSGTSVYDYIEVNGTLYLFADDGIRGFELWKSNGTAEGTVLVKDINPGSGSSIVSYDNSWQDLLLTSVNNTLYFFANDGTHGGELWQSDGTAEGTVLVEDINPGAGSSDIFELTNIDGTLYFNANGRLWALNANPPVASPVVSISAIDANAAEAGNEPAVFRISRTGDTSTALTVKYDVDGTATNGQDYDQLNGTIAIAAGQSFVDLSITPLADTFPEESETLTVTLFDKYYQYYLVDSSSNAASATIADDPSTVVLTEPYLVKDIFPGPSDSNILSLAKFGDFLYFAADDGINGSELWKSDGTAAGTVLFQDIVPGLSGSNPVIQLNIDSVFYFTADDGIYGRNDLWKSDGTQDGTVLVKDLPGSDSSYIDNRINVSGNLYFFAYENSGSSSGYSLWKSNGTTAGTVKLKTNTYSLSDLINVNDTVYFTSFDNTYGLELWKSDGTSAGTVRVKDINSGSGSSDPTDFLSINNTLYFLANDGIRGVELWKSNGTSAGTVRLTDINPSFGSISDLRNVNDILYFTANAQNNYAKQLWRSDGTATGTVLLKDISETSDSLSINLLTNYKGSLYFTINQPTSQSLELWKSDGTQSGTVLVQDINSVNSIYYYATDLSNLTEVDGILYFFYGDTLWKSDGTQNGTVLVKDVFAGDFDGSTNISTQSIDANGTLYFSFSLSVYDPYNPINIYELWKSDGTTEGTVLVKDRDTAIAADFNPNSLIYLNDTLYFTAEDDIYGQELWAIKTDNVINGGNSRDPLTGTAGGDRIIGGTGKKTITGGAGNDEFIYTSIREVGQRITDFTVGSDKIVLTQLLDSLVSGGYNGSNAIADGYVRLVQGSAANSTILQIDRDGAVGNAVFRNFIELDNVTSQAMNNPSNFVF